MAQVPQRCQGWVDFVWLLAQCVRKTVLYNAPTAPWGGHSFHGVLAGVARQYFADRDSSCPLYHLLYEDRLGSHCELWGLFLVVCVWVLGGGGGEAGPNPQIYGEGFARGRPLGIPKDICHELGEDGPEMGSEEHMRRIFERLSSCPKFHSKGVRVKLGRWQSWFKATNDWRGQRFTVLLVLLYLGLRKRWFKSLKELPWTSLPDIGGGMEGEAHAEPQQQVKNELTTPGSALGSMSSASAPAHQAPCGPSPAPRSSSSSSPAPPTPRPREVATPAVCASGVAPAPNSSDTPRTVRDSNAELRKVRSQCKNTLHFCCLVLSNRFSHQITDCVDIVCDPSNQFFDLGITECRTREGNLHFHLGLCHGGFKHVMDRMLSKMHCPEALKAIRFLPIEGAGMYEEAQLQQDAYLANLMLSIWMSVAKNMLMSSMAFSHRFPGFFIALLDPDRDARAAALRRIEGWAKLLAAAEVCALADPWVKQFLVSLVWPQMTYVREVLAMLFEISYDEAKVTDEIREAVAGYAYSFLSTKINEDMFNRLRRRETSHQSEQLGRLSRWHVAASSDVLKEYDLQPVVVTAAARQMTCHKPPPGCFQNLSADGLSLGEAALSEMVKPGAFPAQSPGTNKLGCPAWCCVTELNGDWAKIKLTWLSLLASPGLVLRSVGIHNDGGNFVRSAGPLGAFGAARRLGLALSVATNKIFEIVICLGGRR